jgi:hypothetical protein
VVKLRWGTGELIDGPEISAQKAAPYTIRPRRATDERSCPFGCLLRPIPAIPYHAADIETERGSVPFITAGALIVLGTALFFVFAG